MPPAMSKMPRPLIVKQLHYDLTPVAGLALVGHYLHAVGPVLGRVDAALPVKGGVLNSDILRSYLVGHANVLRPAWTLALRRESCCRDPLSSIFQWPDFWGI